VRLTDGRDFEQAAQELLDGISDARLIELDRY
jgi:hypothetical protein